jgi:alkylhydroperoxidase family enzyme
MAALLDEIDWGEPLVEPAWEAEAKRYGGASDYTRRLAPIPWLRRTCAAWMLCPLTALPLRLADLAFLVVSQENSCRYCYGAARAHLRILGYPERLIGEIERDMQLAELDHREHAFIRFCRQLARSNPRPARAQRDELMRLGFTELQIKEATFLIANHCLQNRVASMLACPPVLVYERLGRSFVGRLLRPILAQANRKSIPVPADFVAAPDAPFARLTGALAGLPAAYLLDQALNGAFESKVLSRRLKALMFGVVARLLECGFCEPESRKLLRAEGFDDAEAAACLASLTSPRLDPQESAILAWVRETVRYQPGQLQMRTRELRDLVGAEAVLEAVGVAALANTTARVAMLLE